jgi:hypothetical protein
MIELWVTSQGNENCWALVGLGTDAVLKDQVPDFRYQLSKIKRSFYIWFEFQFLLVAHL